MIIDASVWVAIFRENDFHHDASVAFLDLAVSNQQDLNIPNLALAEIAGVFARQTGKARLATRTVRAVLALPRVQRHGLNDALGDRGCCSGS
jgi:predicted nucleic acid-binding protein